MPFALVVIGLVMIVTGAQNTHAALGEQLRKDFTGPNNFIFWIASIGAVGAIGYVESFRNFSRAFMALILIAMILSNRGFFDQFSAALRSGPVASPTGGGEDSAGNSRFSPFDITAPTANYNETSANARENFKAVANVVTKLFIPIP